VINNRYGDYHGLGYGTVQVTVPQVRRRSSSGPRWSQA
jgi:hypothetical protein